MPYDISEPIRNINGGNLDSWNRLYTTVAEANATIPNVLDGRGVNFRSGKEVQIGTEATKETYWWKGGFGNDNLVPKVDLSDVPTLDKVYTKDETYSKEEVYDKSEVYDKAEIDQAIVGLSPDSSVLIPIFDSKVDRSEKDTLTGYLSVAADSFLIPDVFGCVGDGVTDDTSSFQDCVNYCDANGYNIFIPKGKNYKRTASVNIYGKTSIYGNGGVLSGNAGINYNSTATNVKVNGVGFDGSFLRVSCNGLEISDNSFKNVYENCITCGASAAINGLTIERNLFDNIHPNDFSFFYSKGRAFYQSTSCPSINKFIFRDNICTNFYSGSVVYLTNLVTDFEISSNTINNTEGQGILFFSINNQSSGVVRSNTIKRMGFLRNYASKSGNWEGGVGANAIYISNVPGVYYDSIEVIGNTVEYCYENGIEGTFGLVKGNTVKYTGYDLANFPTPSPEGIFNGRRIENNTIIDCAGHGIYLFSSNISDVVVKDNTITRSVTSSTYDGVSVRVPTASTATIQNTVIKNNNISGFRYVVYFQNNIGTVSGNEIGLNTYTNCLNYVGDVLGGGVSLISDGSEVDVIDNGNFKSWFGSTLVNWDKGNSNIVKTVDADGDEVPRVVATDANKGRILQGSDYIQLSTKSLINITFKALANVPFFVRIYPYNANGSVNTGLVYSFVYNQVSSTDYQSYSFIWNKGGRFRLEIGTNGVANDWVQPKDIRVYHINK